MLHINSGWVDNQGLKETIKDIVLSTLKKKTGSQPNHAYISKQGTELCVCCGEDTGVPALLNINERPYWVDGCGQHCKDCF